MFNRFASGVVSSRAVTRNGRFASEESPDPDAVKKIR
jgi:hypothetical protein